MSRDPHYLAQELGEEVRRDRGIFEFIRSAALDGLWYWDLTQPEHEWMDERFWITLGYDPATKPHLASAWQDLIHPDDLRAALASFERHCADPAQPYDLVVRYRHAKGSTVWVRCRGLVLRDAAGKPRRMLGAHQDITALELAKVELERANHALRENVELRTQELGSALDELADAKAQHARERTRELRELIEGLPLLVWTCTPEGPCDYLSKQWVSYTGIPEQEQLGTAWVQQLHPDDVPPTQAAWGEAVGRGEPFDTEFRIRRHDGQYRWFATRASPLRDADGHIVKWVGTNVDVHDRKVLEVTLTERTAELERSNAELEQFAYVASHDLQEPLRTITSYVQLLERRYGAALDDKGREYVRYVVAGARRMRSLITDLLAYSRATLVPPQQGLCDGERALQLAVESVAGLLSDSGAELHHEPLGPVRMEEAALVRVLQNLISNAVHYRSSQRPIVRIASRCEEDDLLISVRDNGIGIAPEHHRRIFQMFQRLHVDDDRPGTGVGLALCRRLVEDAGGEIWVESALGEGSTFVIRLPVEGAAA